MFDGCFIIKIMFSVAKKQIDFCHRELSRFLYLPYNVFHRTRPLPADRFVLYQSIWEGQNKNV